MDRTGQDDREGTKLYTELAATSSRLEFAVCAKFPQTLFSFLSLPLSFSISLSLSRSRSLLILDFTQPTLPSPLNDPLAAIEAMSSIRAKRPALLMLLLSLLLLSCDETLARRGRSRNRSKSRVQIGLPITGKYRDPESDQYYNNNNGAKILLASHFDFEYVLGHKIAFLCVARGTPTPHITWYKDGNEIYSHHYLHVHEWKMGKDKVKSKLEIDPATQMDAGVYECTADNMYAIDRRSFKTDFSIAFD